MFRNQLESRHEGPASESRAKDLMRILVSGAGIAGLTAAFWLNRSGHDLTIVEKSPALRDGGYMIDFVASGYDVSEKMGILDKLAEIHYPISRVSFLDGVGREKFSISYPAFRQLFDNRHFNFMRGELERVLHSEIADTVPIKFGTTIQSLTFEQKQVCAELSDGTSAYYDLVVGADGVHSRVRQLVFGEERGFERLLGYHTAAFILDQSPQSFALDNAFYTMTVPGRQFGVYPIRGDRVATFFIHKADWPIRDLSSNAAREELRRTYGDLKWIVPEILKGSESAEIYFDEVSQIEMPGWSHSSVVLVGDACQCVSLAAGQGASLAMAGGYLLAREIAKSPENIALALSQYEQEMKPAVWKKQRAGRRVVKWFFPDNRLRLAVRDSVMRLAASSFGRYFLKRFLATKSIAAVRSN